MSKINVDKLSEEEIQSLIGTTIGRITIKNIFSTLKDKRRTHKKYKAECTCSCGRDFTLSLTPILNGEIKSCGCTKPSFKNVPYENIYSTLKNKLYRTWNDIRNRCSSPKNREYKNYGGRGIKVCEEWNKFDNFEKWAKSSGYRDDLTIERIDNDGDYCPENCMWETRSNQIVNSRKHEGCTSKYRGVHKNKEGRFESYIDIEKKRTRLGKWSTESEAITARDKYIIEHKLWKYKLQFLNPDGSIKE